MRPQTFHKYCFLATFLFLLSCHKESKTTGGNCQIASVEIHANNGELPVRDIYTYDDQGRITRVDEIGLSSGSMSSSFYAYGNGQITYTTSFSSTPSIFYLDNNNRVVKFAVVDTTDGVVNSGFIYYSYSQDGHLAQTISVDSNKFNSNRDTAVIVWGSNGNPSQINHFQSSSSPGTTNVLGHFTTSIVESNEKYMYLTGYESVLSSYQPDVEYNVISKYQGTPPVNLMASYSPVSLEATLTYSYTKNSDGYIASMVMTYSAGKVATYTFTYNCH